MVTGPGPARLLPFEGQALREAERELERGTPVARRSDSLRDADVARERRVDRSRPLVELAVDSDGAAWDAYASSRPGATAYHLFGWKRVAERAYGLQAPFLLVRDGRSTALRGVLPLFVIDRPFGRYVTSGLFGAYGPLLADDADAASALLDCARGVTEAYKAGLLHLKLLETDRLPAPFRRQDIWVTARLALGDPAEVWSRLSRGHRNMIRKAQKNHLRVETGHHLLGPFYDVLAENMHRKGSPIYGQPFIREMLEAFGERAELVVLKREDEVISGALTLSFNGILYVPFASSRARFFGLRPNHLLYWEIIERACARNLSELDFGTSMLGQSTLEFKMHWHPRLLQVTSHLYSRSKNPPVIVPTGAKVQLAMRLWSMLPRRVADRLGPRVLKWTA